MESYLEEDVQPADQIHVPCNSKVRVSNQNFKKQDHNTFEKSTAAEKQSENSKVS